MILLTLSFRHVLLLLDDVSTADNRAEDGDFWADSEAGAKACTDVEVNNKARKTERFIFIMVSSEKNNNNEGAEKRRK